MALLTEQLGAVASGDAHELLLAAGMETEVRRQVVHDPIEDGPCVVGGLVLEKVSARDPRRSVGATGHCSVLSPLDWLLSPCASKQLAHRKNKHL